MATLDEIINQLRQSVGMAIGIGRNNEQKLQQINNEHALQRQELQRQGRDLQNLAGALERVKGTGGGSSVQDHIRYIESIPGRRIPFDLLVPIVIGSTVATVQQGTAQISQDGPFVAVARYATFQSGYTFSFRDPETGTLTTFQGRSFGRYRPIHSAHDNTDAIGGYQPVVGAAFPGTGAAIYASPSNHSNFRSMEFDGSINFLNGGSGFPRSNIGVPSSFWTTMINSPFQLGALDFFERGETLQWQVQPTHINNPTAGNVFGFAGGAGAFPFLDSQYDVHEGILDPFNPDSPNVDEDPVTRLPDGILYIGFHGFRIIQPPGPVALS